MNDAILGISVRTSLCILRREDILYCRFGLFAPQQFMASIFLCNEAQREDAG